MPDMTDFMRSLAARSLESQKRDAEKASGPPDYTGEDGLLYCGKCHSRKQMWLKNDFFPEPMLVATSCDCMKEAEERRRKEEEYQRDMDKIERLRLSSMMDSKFSAATFDAFQQTKNNARNLRLCRRYAENFDEMMTKNQGLLFYGDVGTGKTFSAACIANYLLNRKIPTVMTSFVKIIGNADLRNREESMYFTDRLNRAKLLIIDDLGAERGTDYALERVYDIIDSRYRCNKPLIVTTNLKLDELKHPPDLAHARIYDRILERCAPILFAGKNFREGNAASTKAAARRIVSPDNQKN